MPYIRLPLGIRVALEYDWNGKAVVNIYHITTTDPITTVKLTDIANEVIQLFTAGLVNYLSQEISVTGASALNLDVPNGERVYVPETPPTPGLYAQESVSNNVASVVSLRTALTGRSYQGRSYIPGIPEAEVSQNQLSALITTGFATSFALFEAGLAAHNAQLVVASFQTLGIPRAQGVATPVDSVLINSRVDTQRRRLPKV